MAVGSSPSVSCDCNKARGATVVVSEEGWVAEKTIRALPGEDSASRVDASGQDVEAFAGLYDAYVKPIYRYIYVRIGESVEAEDLTGQVFLRAWRAWGRYRDQTGSPAAWLYRIAHNVVIDHRRTQKIEPNLDDHLDLVGDADPAETVLRRVGQERLVRAIRQLRTEHQRVVVLRFVEGLGYPEVAAALGKSEGAVRVIQHRALATLRTILAGD